MIRPPPIHCASTFPSVRCRCFLARKLPTILGRGRQFFERVFRFRRIQTVQDRVATKRYSVAMPTTYSKASPQNYISASDIEEERCKWEKGQKGRWKVTVLVQRDKVGGTRRNESAASAVRSIEGEYSTTAAVDVEGFLASVICSQKLLWEAVDGC